MNFILEEATIADIQAAITKGEMTSKKLVLMYFERIASLDKGGPAINSVLELNPDALFIAEALDYERFLQGPRGPLHGIPVLLKDNINTHDKMHTSAGSLALADSYALEDAYLVKKLREAGAIILGKANMTEFANFMSHRMPSGYSSRGGQVLNPYNVAETPSGSSSGSAVAVAASFCTVAVGTETSGSILSPANVNGIVGIKPTVGLISRAGVIPISNSQDTAGPMARTVTDAVILLGAMTGVDPDDSATWTSKHRGDTDYRRFLASDGLRGARIGVDRSNELDFNEEEASIFTCALETLQREGSILIDSTNLPQMNHSSSVLLNEFKSSLNAYLSTLGANAPIRSLQQIIDYNLKHPIETLKYGQTWLTSAQSDTSGALTEPQYIRDRARDLRMSQAEGIDALMQQHKLDAIISLGVTDVAAIAGYPSIIVPAGLKDNGLPLGLTFIAGAYEEPVLIKLAYAYEQATKVRTPPVLQQDNEDYR